MPKAYRRRDYFVKKWLQTRFIFYYLAVLTIGGFALAAVIYRDSKKSLRFAMFQGHSTELTTWEVLRPEITAANLAVTLVVTLIAVLITLLVSWVVARAARTVVRNIYATLEGRALENWTPVSRPREFQQFQSGLAEGITAHRKKVATLRRAGGELAVKVRETREAEHDPDHIRLRELRLSYEKLRNLYQAIKLP